MTDSPWKPIKDAPSKEPILVATEIGATEKAIKDINGDFRGQGGFLLPSCFVANLRYYMPIPPLPPKLTKYEQWWRDYPWDGIFIGERNLKEAFEAGQKAGPDE